jgi:hypothetical protein
MTIPPEYGNLTNMKTLYWFFFGYLNEDDARGQEGNATVILILISPCRSFYDIRLSGTIPPELGRLNQVTDLYFNSYPGNGYYLLVPDHFSRTLANEVSLSGTLPRSLANMPLTVVYSQSLCVSFLVSIALFFV